MHEDKFLMKEYFCILCLNTISLFILKIKDSILSKFISFLSKVYFIEYSNFNIGIESVEYDEYKRIITTSGYS